MLSLVGLALGVSCLIVAMAVVSGYLTTLSRSIQDVVGHLLVVKRSAGRDISWMSDLQKDFHQIKASTPFFYAEGVLVHSGRMHGVVVEGIEPETVHQVLNLEGRLTAGEFNVSIDVDAPQVIIGKGLAKKLNLGVGDTFRIIVPQVVEFRPEAFRSQKATFTIAGIVDLGRQDYDSRYILAHLSVTQELAAQPGRVTGFRLRIENPDEARRLSETIVRTKGLDYWAQDWSQVNRNLFEAAAIEKMIIFFVLLVIVLAAALNVAGCSFMSVVKRYRDLSLLKALGFSERGIFWLILWQGLRIGWVGSLLGVVLGYALCQGFMWAQVQFQLIPGEVYKLSFIEVDMRLEDIMMIVLTAIVFCLLASLGPARRAARQVPSAGLRYE